MPLFRVTGTDVHRHQPRVYFVEADSVEAAAGHMARRGIEQAVAELATEPELNAVVYRVLPSLPTASPPTAGERRIRNAALGFAGAVLLLMMTWFVLRAKEHLTRTDLRPHEPPQETPPPIP